MSSGADLSRPWAMPEDDPGHADRGSAAGLADEDRQRLAAQLDSLVRAQRAGRRRRRRRVRGWPGAVVAVVLLLAAAVVGDRVANRHSWTELATIERLRLAGLNGATSELVWTERGLVGARSDFVLVLEVQDVDSGRVSELPIDAPGCGGPDHRVNALSPLAGERDRVGAALECQSGLGSDDRVVVVDLTTGATEEPFGRPTYMASSVAFAPGGETAAVGDESNMCASVRWMDADGEDVRDVVVGEASMSWSLADHFAVEDERLRFIDELERGREVDPPVADCSNAGGLARRPAWSDQGELALMISPQSMHRHDLFRAESPFDVWISAADGSGGRTALAGVHELAFPRWSPGGRCLAFRASIDGTRALWVLEPSSGDLVLVSRGWYGAVTWSPDGERLAAWSYGKSRDEVTVFRSGPLADRCSPTGVG